MARDLIMTYHGKLKVLLKSQLSINFENNFHPFNKNFEDKDKLKCHFVVGPKSCCFILY